MKKIIPLVAALLAGVFIAPTVLATTMNTSTSKQHKYRFQYPVNWKVKNKKDTEGNYRELSLDSKTATQLTKSKLRYTMTFRRLKLSADEQATLAKGWTDFRALVESIYGELGTVSQKAKAYSLQKGYQAFVITGKFKEGGYNAYQRGVYATKDGKTVYEITGFLVTTKAGAYLPSFSVVGDMFNDLTRTFRIL